MKISTIHKTIRREKPVALPRSTVKFCEACKKDLYEEFLELARIVVEGRATA